MSDVHRCLRRCLLILFAVVVVAVGSASAQVPPWPQPDGYDFTGVCCTPANPTLPPFPSITQNIKYMCWRDCQPQLCRDLCVTIGTPRIAAAGGVVFGCGVYFVPVTIKRGAQVLYSGRLIGTYARTWLEDTVPDPIGLKETQVWRFLLNGDLLPSALIQGIANPCVAQCWRTFGAIYFAGYIDYRNFCPNNSWTAEWALDHGCDFWAHNADSGRPAPVGSVLHPTFSYTFVGPNTFTCSINIPVSAGPVMAESVRSILWFGNQPPTCLTDDPLVQGSMVPLQDFCPCGAPPAAAPQYTLTDFNGISQCGTQFRTGGAGPKPFAQKRLGFFTDAAGGPFKFLLLKMGDVDYIDACLPPPIPTREYFEGVETIGGFPAFDLNGRFLGRQFDDDGSSNFLVCQRRKGVPHVVCKIITANMP